MRNDRYIMAKFKLNDPFNVQHDKNVKRQLYLLSEIFSSFKNSPQRQYVAQEEYQDDKGEE